MQGALRLRLRGTRGEAGNQAPDLTASDAELAARAVDDGDAFAALYARYVESVYRYCFHRLGERTAAEDATSLVFVRALAALPRYRERGSFRAWLFAIAHNVVIDHARRAHRSGAGREGPLADDFVDPAPSPEEVVVASLAADSLQALLAELPEDQRQVLELRLSGLASPEVARLLGRSPTAIRSLQFRAVERLRRILAGNAATDGRTAEDYHARR